MACQSLRESKDSEKKRTAASGDSVQSRIRKAGSQPVPSPRHPQARMASSEPFIALAEL
uniref:Uncharacterized protein n=1 Tax=Physcomitrium patens TaxID=3218 RepID=A0A2K1KM37_PHYPA|nr:hypothetical protein PHYPA_005729 [Physcomitrium patens]